MFTPRNLRLIGIVVVCLALAASGVWNSSGGSPKARAEEVKDPKLKELLTERLAALKQAASFATHLFQNARIQFETLRAANKEMYDAELELCETDKERIEVLERMLATAKQSEERSTALRVGAQGTEFNVLKAKVDRLNAEILLLRVKAQ